jgi:FkbM family methyltransferase
MDSFADGLVCRPEDPVYLSMDTQSKLMIARILSRTLRAARKTAGLPTSRLRCKRGDVWWSLDLSEGIDLSIYLFGGFEKRTSKTLRRFLKKGHVTLDIGANVGAHALPMARHVGPEGRVFAFEPTDSAFEKLKLNLSLNADLTETLVPQQILLSDQEGPIPDRIHSSWNLDGRGDHPIHGGVLQTRGNSRTATLDEWAREIKLSRLDFIKMDVDGFEGRILRGGKATLDRFRPSMILELTPYALEEHGDSLEDLVGFLSGIGYELWTEDGRSRLKMNAGILRKIMPDRGGMNVLALFAS